jgi:hypothetical protein
MHIAKRLVAGVLLMSLVALLSAVIAPQTARGANPQAVVVTNTPLPVHLDNATVPVSGTVGINSLPAVTLSGTPQVSVANTSSTPLFADAEHAARHAASATCDFTFTSPPSFQSCQMMTVPAGTILVIETVTCRAQVPPGGGIGPFTLDMVPPNANYFAGYDLALARANNIPGSDNYALTSSVRLYAAGSTNVSLSGIGTTGSVVGSVICSIAGYLVAQ